MTNITEEEAKLYDRQIRLWGLDAQKRLRTAKIMVIGIGGLGAELIKNIALSGVGHIHLVDNVKITPLDFKSQFLIRREDLGKNRAKSSIAQIQKLNPMVKISFDESNDLDIFNLSSDWLAKNIDQSYTIVCATLCSTDLASRINDRCREIGVKFFFGDTFGYFGFSFMDLGSNYEYIQDVPIKKKVELNTEEPSLKKQKIEEPVVKTLKKQMQFIPYNEIIAYDWSKNMNVANKTPAIYFIVSILQRFRSEYGRNAVANDDDDIQKLHSMERELVECLHLPTQQIIKDKLKYCSGEICSVSAITGGIMAQEMIKAISFKDPPLNNVFLFDASENCGYVDRLGFKDG